jgi:tRNA-2-methylthio-N6-dimethylallyladenosine synthase
LRKVRPDLTFSSDFIVGFPGETEEDFEQTMDLIRRVGFVSTYSFKYSARPGTPAANMKNLVRDDIASDRLQRLQALINEQQIAFNEQCIGMTVPVLFDRKGKREGQLIGRSPFNQSVFAEANERLIDTMVNVTLTEGFENSMTGTIDTVEEVLQKA